MQILGQKSILDPASPLSLKPDLPPQVATICHKMIAKNNVDRYQTLSDVIADLNRIDFSLAPPVIDTPPVDANPFPDFVVSEPSSASGADVRKIDVSFAPPNRSTPPVEASPFSDFVVSEQSIERKAQPVKRTQPQPANGVRNSSATFKTRFQQLAAWWNGQSLLMKRTSVGGAAFLLLCGVIIITITSKDGTQTKIEVSDKSKVEVTTDRSGSRKTSDGKSLARDRSLTTSATAKNTTGWHGWPADAPKPAIAPFDTIQAKQHQEEWAKYLKVPVEYTNSIGMKFRLIPPGEFMMGSTAAEVEAALKDHGENKWHEFIKFEAPQHQVILRQPIYLSVNEVTQAEYEKVMGTNPSFFSPVGRSKEAVAGMETANYPVDAVSWNDAAEFCAKLSQEEKFKPFYLRAGDTVTPLDGTGYRLPSEAEWEFACRAGTITKYWIGDSDEDLMRAGWFGTNSGGRTHAVSELQANPFGLADIHGNVLEWVQDGWDATYYSQFQNKPAINPISPLSASSQVVLRGGYWHYTAPACRASMRVPCDPAGRWCDYGIRASLTLGAVQAKLAEGKASTPLATTDAPIDVSTPPILPNTVTGNTAREGKELVPPRIDPPPVAATNKNSIGDRKLTDPLLRVGTSLDSFFEKGARNPVVDRRLPKPLVTKVSNGVVYANEVYRRFNVICTHPASTKQAATIDFSAITKNHAGILTITAHSYPSMVPSAEIAVLIDGKPSPDRTIRIFDIKWHTMTIPFDRNDVVIEHRAIGWEFEGMFFNYHIWPKP